MGYVGGVIRGVNMGEVIEGSAEEWRGGGGGGVFFFKQKTAYEVTV